jgi:hypothetical protein
MSKHKIPLSTAPLEPGEVNIAFAIKLGAGHVQYVGPIEEDIAKQMLALLGKRLFPAANQAEAARA